MLLGVLTSLKVRGEFWFGFNSQFCDAEKRTRIVLSCCLVAAVTPARTSLGNYKEQMCSSELDVHASPNTRMLGCTYGKGCECTGTYTL